MMCGGRGGRLSCFDGSRSSRYGLTKNPSKNLQRKNYASDGALCGIGEVSKKRSRREARRVLPNPALGGLFPVSAEAV